MQADTSHRVRKRRVFYFPGYDPFHPRRYRELYRKEAAAQAQISDFKIGLTPQTNGDRYGWHVDAHIENSHVETDFEVLVWSDLVRDSMDQGILATYWQLIRTAWVYIASGALWRLMRLRKGPVIAALYPVGFFDPSAYHSVTRCCARWNFSRGVAFRAFLDWSIGDLADTCVVSQDR